MPIRFPKDKDGDGVREAESEVDTQCTEHPVDGRQVGAGPDPELAGHLPGAGWIRGWAEARLQRLRRRRARAGRDCSGVVLHVGPP